MNHAYDSFNKALQAIWAGIVGTKADGSPLVPIVFEVPEAPRTLPADCLRVHWLSNGGDTGQPNELVAEVQLDVFVPPRQEPLALARCAALNRALGFTSGAGEGCVGRYDWSTAPETYLSEMTVTPLDTSWDRVPDPKPGQIHLARTVVLTYLV